MLKSQSNGLPLYIGQHTSVLYFAEDQERWVWTDKKDNKSAAFSRENMESLLLGTNKFDFSDFKDDCVEPAGGHGDKLIKLTSCDRGGWFTCRDGQRMQY